MLTRPLLSTLWPRARAGKIDAIVAVAPAIFAEHGLTTPLRVAHFLSQVSHENGAGTIVREVMTFSTQSRLFDIYGGSHHSAHLTQQECKDLLGKPYQLAERVYGIGNPTKAREFGHTQEGDGFKYRGGGDLQITGKSNYIEVGQKVGIDLTTNPDILSDPAISFKVAVAEFVAAGCLPAADADNGDAVTRIVNGGSPNARNVNGMAERMAWLQRWKSALAAENAQPDEAPVEQLEAALAADAMPRGAEVKEPKFAPEVTTAVGIGDGVVHTAGGEIAKQIQTDLTPLTYMFTGLKWMTIAIGAICAALTIYGIIQRARNAKRV